MSNQPTLIFSDLHSFSNFAIQNYTFSFRKLLYKFLFLLLFLRIEVILYSKTEKM